MQAQKDYFYSAFFTFICLWFTRLYLFCPLFLFFKLTCVEFHVRIMLHFAYSIFYIKPQTISIVKYNDIALNSCAVLLSFFVIDGMETSLFQQNGDKQINFQIYSIFDILVHINCILTRQSVPPASFISQSSVSEHNTSLYLLCNFSLLICYALSV